ncbi:hypothetical protein V8E54_009813 [Elaphomyces granulatus]
MDRTDSEARKSEFYIILSSIAVTQRMSLEVGYAAYRLPRQNEDGLQLWHSLMGLLVHILLTEALYVRRSKAYDFKTREDGEDYWIVFDPWGDLGSFLHLMSSIFSSLFETTCFSSKLPEMTPTNVAGTW